MAKVITQPPRAADALPRPDSVGQRSVHVVGMATPAKAAPKAIGRALMLTEGWLISVLPGLPHATVRQLLAEGGVSFQDGSSLVEALQQRWDAIPRPGQVARVELLDGDFQLATMRQSVGRYQALVALVEEPDVIPEPAAMIYNVARGVGAGPSLLQLVGVELGALWAPQVAAQE